MTPERINEIEDEMRSPGFGLARIERHELLYLLRAARERDELRARLVQADENWAEFKRVCAESVELRDRAEKAEADLAESKRLVEKAEARVKELPTPAQIEAAREALREEKRYLFNAPLEGAFDAMERCESALAGLDCCGPEDRAAPRPSGAGEGRR